METMKKRLLGLLVLLLGMILADNTKAQTIRVPLADDGVPIVRLHDVIILSKKANRNLANDYRRNEKKFNKLRFNIMKVLPYANEAAKNLKVIKAELARIPSESGKDTYLKSREHFLFGKYENEIAKLSPMQGRILIKLVDRQCGSTTFELLRNYRSGATAALWQGVGAVFGFNLKEDYDPEEDLAIEVIVLSIEKGQNPTYYDFVQAALHK